MMIRLNIRIGSPDPQTDDGLGKSHHTGDEYSLRAPCLAKGTRQRLCRMLRLGATGASRALDLRSEAEWAARLL